MSQDTAVAPGGVESGYLDMVTIHKYFCCGLWGEDVHQVADPRLGPKPVERSLDESTSGRYATSRLGTAQRE